MSRDNAGSNRQAASDETDGNETANHGNSGLLGRRRFLQAAGAGIAATVGLSGTASAADYKTIKLSSGEHWSHSLSDGEVFENVLFDCTASNTRVSLKASASNWTIRNVGIKGVHDQSGGHAVMALNAHGNSDCLIENVWMGDGSAVYDGASSSETGAWVSPKSSGTITFRNCFFEGWKDNAIYASACGRDGNGPVVIDNCFARNNNHADFRIGSSGSVVKNSVVEHTENGSGVRGIWCWYNKDLEVRNCNVDVANYGAAIHAGPYAPGEVDVYDTQYKGSLVEDGQGNGDIRLQNGNGTGPNCSVPDGIPQSAEEAASGATSTSGSGPTNETGSTTELPNTLVVDSPDGGAVAEYQIVATGEIRSGSDTESDDNITQNDDGTYTLTGLCSDGWVDSYTFEGEINDYTVSGGRVGIVVNGTVINPVDTSSLRVETPEGGDLVHYEITTTGRISSGDAAEGTDDISQNSDGTWTLSGMTGDGYADSFEFAGEVSDYSTSGGRAAIVVDGEAINPTNTLRVETPEGGDLVRYEVTTSGPITPGNEAEGSDKISQNDDGSYTVAGVSGDGYADSFTFEGEVTDYSITGGQASIVVNGETRNTVETHTMRLQSPTGGDLVRYEVVTTGRIRRGDAAEGSDKISQNDDGTYTLAGVTGDGYADTFEFTGSVKSLSSTGGEVALLVDGQEVQP